MNALHLQILEARTEMVSKLRKLETNSTQLTSVKSVKRENKLEDCNKYEDLMGRHYQYDSVKFINLSLSTIGVFSLRSADFCNMLQETGFDDKHVNYIIRTLTIIAIRTTY